MKIAMQIAEILGTIFGLFSRGFLITFGAICAAKYWGVL